MLFRSKLPEVTMESPLKAPTSSGSKWTPTVPEGYEPKKKKRPWGVNLGS